MRFSSDIDPYVQEAYKQNFEKRHTCPNLLRRISKNYSSKNKRERTLHRDNLIWETFKRVCPDVVVTEQFDDTALNNYMHRRIANGKMNGEKLKKASVNREAGMLKNLARCGDIRTGTYRRIITI
jgi:hypothetical protein